MSRNVKRRQQPAADTQKGYFMNNASTATNPSAGSVKPFPLTELLPWATFATLIFMLAIYFVGAEQGAVSMFNGTGVHEMVHDARHALGFPCH